MIKNLKSRLILISLIGLFLGEISFSPTLAARDETDLQPLHRVWAVQRFLRRYDSPLSENSSKFIEVAEKYHLDWRLLVSISGIESTFGKFLPYKSYNPFGFDNGGAVFKNFNEGIERVGFYLFEMKNKGFDSPERIGPIYTPPNYKNWINAVNYFELELGKSER